jgi:hypothetical protein
VKSIGTTQLHLGYCWASDVFDTTISYGTIDGYFGNLMNGDLNGDRIVDLFDAIAFANSFGALPGYLGWSEEADLTGDGLIDIYDAIMLCNHFGHTS